MSPDITQPTVLIAEDEAVLANVLSNKLRRHGFCVLLSTDGNETLRVMRESRPALVLLDLVMPNMNGFQVLEEAKVDPALSGIRIVVFSNLNQPEDRERARSLGAVDFLVKSDISINDVVERVRGYIAPR